MKSFTHNDKLIIFFLFVSAVFTGKENVPVFFKWLEIDTSPGAVFFLLYLYILLLFDIPFLLSLKTAAFFFGVSALCASIGLPLLAETLAVFSFSLIIINTIRLLHVIKSAQE